MHRRSQMPGALQKLLHHCFWEGLGIQRSISALALYGNGNQIAPFQAEEPSSGTGRSAPKGQSVLKLTLSRNCKLISPFIDGAAPHGTG